MPVQEIRESHGYGEGVLTHARAWLADCDNNRGSVVDGHETFVALVAKTLLGQSPTGEKDLDALSNIGIEVGYCKAGCLVTISYPTAGYRVSRPMNEIQLVLADFEGDQLNRHIPQQLIGNNPRL